MRRTSSMSRAYTWVRRMSFELLTTRWQIHPMTSTQTLSIRPASQDDAVAIARLAALDSAEAPAGETLLAIVDGQPLAALSLASGAVVADPFAPTADLVVMLRQRAALLGGSGTRAPRARRALLARVA